MLTHFSASEIEELCLYLGINHEDLDGRNRRDRIGALVLHCQRHDRLGALREQLAALRPGVAWPERVPHKMSSDVSYCFPTPPETLYERTKEIDQVRNFLLDQREMYPVLAIVGLGGVGKTVMLAKALENFPFMHIDSIICIEMENQTGLVSAIAEKVGLPNSLQSVCTFIGSSNTLVILDGMNQLQETDELSRLLSRLNARSRGKVIITSQWSPSDFPLDESNIIFLSTLTPEAARKCGSLSFGVVRLTRITSHHRLMTSLTAGNSRQIRFLMGRKNGFANFTTGFLREPKMFS